MTIIPDGIEPVEGWRAWGVESGMLVSGHDGTLWPRDEALHAVCGLGTQKRWAIGRSGLTLVEARQTATVHNQMASSHNSMISWGLNRPTIMQYYTVPTVEPPPGLGYLLEEIEHDAPYPDCTCGIYAAAERDGTMNGIVLGKVKLWGTVIEGERGWRGEYAYPSELIVHPELPNDWRVALESYGVPLVLSDEPTLLPMQARRPDWQRRMLWAATGANVAALVANLATHIH